MGQGNNCCKQQVSQLHEQVDLDLQSSQYYGPQYASNYIIEAKFFPKQKKESEVVNENRIRNQTSTTMNQSQQRQSLDNQKADFLINSFQREFHNDLEFHDVNSSLEGSKNLNKSILKQKKIPCSKNSGATKSVRFKQLDEKVKFSKDDNRLLGLLLKRRMQ